MIPTGTWFGTIYSERGRILAAHLEPDPYTAEKVSHYCHICGKRVDGADIPFVQVGTKFKAICKPHFEEWSEEHLKGRGI